MKHSKPLSQYVPYLFLFASALISFDKIAYFSHALVCMFQYFHTCLAVACLISEPSKACSGHQR